MFSYMISGSRIIISWHKKPLTRVSSLCYYWFNNQASYVFSELIVVPHHLYFMIVQQNKATILYILKYVQVDDHCYYRTLKNADVQNSRNAATERIHSIQNAFTSSPVRRCYGIVMK
jgi:hypothetical protein